MDAAVQSSLFALIGVVIGGVATHFFSLQRERENREFIKQSQTNDVRRERLERLYKSITHWALNVSTSSISWMMSMQGKIDYNKALEIATNSISIKDTDPHSIEMLVFIYASDAVSLHEECVKNLSATNEFLGKFKIHYEQNGTLSVFPLLNEYILACRKFEASADVLKKKIAGQIKEI